MSMFSNPSSNTVMPFEGHTQGFFTAQMQFFSQEYFFSGKDHFCVSLCLIVSCLVVSCLWCSYWTACSVLVNQ